MKAFFLWLRPQAAMGNLWFHFFWLRLAALRNFVAKIVFDW
jgi:hypothetical protein